MPACGVCGQQYRMITISHLKHHGLTMQQYRAQYGDDIYEPNYYDGHRKHLIDWATVGLGEAPDSVVAAQLGVSREVVKDARRKLGVPAFVGLILTQEGKPCRSIYEAMYDAYLHWKYIAHQHEVPVDGLPYVADFLVGSQYIEIAGMDLYLRYMQKQMRKRKDYIKHELVVQWLTRGDVEGLYKDCPITLKFRIQRTCLDCGLQTHDIVKGYCRPCYNKRWHDVMRAQAVCKTCGQPFGHDGSSHRDYCSRDCYHASHSLPWPSWEWIDEQLKTMSARQLAFQMGVKPATLAMRLWRHRNGNMDVTR